VLKRYSAWQPLAEGHVLAGQRTRILRAIIPLPRERLPWGGSIAAPTPSPGRRRSRWSFRSSGAVPLRHRPARSARRRARCWSFRSFGSRSFAPINGPWESPQNPHKSGSPAMVRTRNPRTKRHNAAHDGMAGRWPDCLAGGTIVGGGRHHGDLRCGRPGLCGGGTGNAPQVLSSYYRLTSRKREAGGD
jgi:hypothetical protein